MGSDTVVDIRFDMCNWDLVTQLAASIALGVSAQAIDMNMYCFHLAAGKVVDETLDAADMIVHGGGGPRGHRDVRRHACRQVLRLDRWLPLGRSTGSPRCSPTLRSTCS